MLFECACVAGMSSPREMPPTQPAKQQQPAAKRGAKPKQSKEKQQQSLPPPQLLAVRGGRIVAICPSGELFVPPWQRELNAKPSVPPQLRAAAAAAASTTPPLQQSDESKAQAVSAGTGASHQSDKQIA
jgi:hypothetical protein